MKLLSAAPLLFKDSKWNLVFSLTIWVCGWHKLPKIVGMACRWAHRRRLLVLIRFPILREMRRQAPGLASLPISKPIRLY
jgi:hypothetical protein